MNKKDKFYYKDGTVSSEYDDTKVLHRIDGPAIEWADGTKEWYVDGKRHRVDGLAVECANGDKRWYVDDRLHRIDGPAKEWASGNKEWYIDGKLHRIDGPAVECANGDRFWYVDGIYYTEQQFNQLIKEVNEMSLALRLTDPREWVRELATK